MTRHSLVHVRVKSAVSVAGNILQRQCACGRPTGGGECLECEKKQLRRRHAPNGAELTAAPQVVHDVLRSPGRQLDPTLRASMEPSFGKDFSHVRLHDDSRAAESARAVNALAYAVGRSIVFGAGQFSPHTTAGRRLLAHELTHVVQQNAAAGIHTNDLVLGKVDDAAEREAAKVASAVEPVPVLSSSSASGQSPRIAAGTTRSHSGMVQRQLVTPLAPGGGFGGLMDRDRARVSALAATPFHVCSRDLQGFLGLFFNHTYIEAPPYRYAIISPLCGKGLDNPVTGTTAQKWDNSPDPCGKRPTCIPCRPKPGVTDVATCLRSAFSSYNSPNLYRATGPNSNTFAGTLARACCADMVPKPAALGNVPAWDHSPSPARAGKSPCPPGPPTC